MKTRITPRHLFMLPMVLAALFLSIQIAHADISVTVDPTFLEFSGDPGASTSQDINITNDGSEPISMSVAVGDLKSALAAESAATWLSTDRQHAVLQPGESLQVRVTIRIPKDASPGGHFAALYIQASSTGGETGQGQWGGGTGVGASILSSFFITVRSPDPSTLQLDGHVVRVVPVAKGPDLLGFRVEVQNTGNVHFVPKGSIELKDADGQVIGSLPLPEGIPVLPGTTRSYYFNGSLNAAPGNYTASAKVDYSWESWQAEVAETDPEEWSAKEDDEDISFNSVPRLRIKSVTPVVEDDGTVYMDVEVENYGDVEVAPQGYLDFLLPDGQRVFADNLGSASSWVEPHGTTSATVEYDGVIPKGDYTIRSVLSYHGESDAQYDVPITISEDIIPAQSPDLPDERKAQLSVVRGIPTWVTVVAVAAGVVAAVGATLLIQKYHLLSRLFGRPKRG